MPFTFRRWPAADFAATLFVVAALIFIEVVVLSQWVSPSAVAAGCAGAMVGRYLMLSHSFSAAVPWKKRIASLALIIGSILVSVVVVGSLATLAFGR